MIIEYKKILNSAIGITWKNKFLWFFGLFAAFLAGGITYRGVYNDDNSSFISAFEKIKSTGVFDFSIFHKMAELAQIDPIGLTARVAVLLVVIALSIFIFWLAITCQGALINSVAKLSLGKKVDFTDGMQSGIKNFWSVLAFKIIEQVVTFAFLSIMLLPFVVTLSVSINAWLIFVYYVLTFVVFALILLFALVVRYGMSFLVIRGYGFYQSMVEAFGLLRKNMLVSIEATVIIFAVNFLFGFLALMVVAGIAIPFVFLLIVFYKLAFVSGVVLLLMSGIVFLFFVIVLLGGILSAFSDAFWTILFIDLVKEDKRSFVGCLFSFRK